MSSFTLDLAPDDEDYPNVGDLLTRDTNRARAVYRVTGVRPVESRVWSNRWHLDVTRIGDRDQLGVTIFPPDDGRVIWTSVYERGEGPADRFGPDR